MNLRTLIFFTAMVFVVSGSAWSQSYIDFDFIPGGVPADNLIISNQFQATLGVSFILEDGTFPRLAKTGAPRTAFTGFGGADSVAPGVEIGEFFLTDDGVVGAAPSALLVNYDTPVSAASGVILDIDFNEEWVVEAKDAMGNIVASQILPPAGNGEASPFMVDAGMQVITQLRINFTGSGSSIGLAFDNFLTISPGQGLGQANSADASLTINGQGALGAGPFDVLAPIESELNLEWSGPAGLPVALVAGVLNPAAITIPCFGTIDIGTAPTFADLLLVYDGSAFPQSLFYTLSASGQLTHSSLVPASASGAVIGLQGIVYQPFGAPCPAVFTAAFELTIP